MPTFGKRSRAQLDTCRPVLVNICEMVIKDYDFTVLCGRRGEDAQEEAYRTGRSKVRWPNSKHNTPNGIGSQAIDVAPWHTGLPHIRWDNEREFVFLAGRMMQAAYGYGTRLRWGGDWDMDDDLYDRNVPFDLVHFELV
jgi:peptidoglycan L-alanyl-D-glutamate endopeptidase CwlK